MSYTRKAVRGTILIFTINILAAFFGYLIRMLLARNLTPSEYGLFFSVFTLINLLAIFKYLGLDQALVKYIPEFQVHNRIESISSAIVSAFSLSFIISLVLAIILFLSSDYLAEYYFKNYLASWLLQIFALIFLLFTFRDILRGAFQGLQKMIPFSLIYLTENILIFFLVMLFFNLKLLGATLAYLLVYVIIAVVYFPWLAKLTGLFKNKLRLSKQILSKLLKFGIPITLGSIGGMIMLYTDTLILTYFRPLEDVGVYNVVVPTAMLLNFIGLSISQVVFPLFSELNAKMLKGHIQYGIRYLQKYLFAAIFPLSLIILAFPDVVLRILFGEQYVSGAIALQILVMGVFFLIIASLNMDILSALGRPILKSKILFFGALLNFITNFIFIPFYGINGAAFTSLISYLLILILSSLKLRNFVKIEIPWFDWIKIFFSGLVFIAVIFLLKKLIIANVFFEISVCMLVGGLIYLVLLILLKTINLKEIRNIFAKVTR